MSGLFPSEPAEQEALPPPDGPGLFGDRLPAATLEPVHAEPYRVLARKYRPTTFQDLIGQEMMVRTLRNAFAVGRVAHAFMLTGVRGVGKTTTARIIARSLNCVGLDGTGGLTADPCGMCANCIGILADRHPDVIEMDAASRTGVDDMREIIEATRFRPMQARSKVFIIDEVHMLSRNAFNALLKTLEEPPPHVKFLFATTEIRKVPITVLSRCQRFDLRRVRTTELTQHFADIAAKEGVTVEPTALQHIARCADGSVRDGLSMLDQAIALSEGTVTTTQVVEMLGLVDREMVFELMGAVVGGRPATALAITDRAYERGGDLGTLLQDLLDLLHVVTRLKSIPGLRESPDLPEMERTRGAVFADGLSVPTLTRLWQMLLKGLSEMDIALDRRAAAEMVLIRLCYMSDMPTPGDLMRRLTAGTIPAPQAPRSESGIGGGALSVANGRSMMSAEAVSQPDYVLKSFRDVVNMVAAKKEAMLHAHLLHSVHLVRFAAPVIELRPQPEAPRDLASKLSALLSEATGIRWTIAVSAAMGGPTLAEQGRAADTARKNIAADHPLVLEIMATFPGAHIDIVHDEAEDVYGLQGNASEVRTSAPPNAEYFNDEPMESEL